MAGDVGFSVGVFIKIIIVTKKIGMIATANIIIVVIITHHDVASRWHADAIASRWHAGAIRFIITQKTGTIVATSIITIIIIISRRRWTLAC